MQIEYKNQQIEKICTDARIAEKKYGKRMAERIQQRIDQISAACSIEMMLQYGVGRCHYLKGDRKRQLAVDLVGAYRLVFEKREKEVVVAYILEIVDYH